MAFNARLYVIDPATLAVTTTEFDPEKNLTAVALDTDGESIFAVTRNNRDDVYVGVSKCPSEVATFDYVADYYVGSVIPNGIAIARASGAVWMTVLTETPPEAGRVINKVDPATGNLTAAIGATRQPFTLLATP